MKTLRAILLACFWAAAIISIALIPSFVLTGCTITPTTVESATASFDGNEQNSGILAILPDGGAHVTPHFLDRYAALVSDYGKLFSPTLVKNAGVTLLGDGSGEIDRQHLVQFIQMNTWKKSGRAKP